MGDEGLEQSAESSGRAGHSQTDDAESDAFLADSSPIDPDLAMLIHAWPTLRATVKAQIVVVVRAATGKRGGARDGCVFLDLTTKEAEL